MREARKRKKNTSQRPSTWDSYVCNDDSCYHDHLKARVLKLFTQSNPSAMKSRYCHSQEILFICLYSRNPDLEPVIVNNCLHAQIKNTAITVDITSVVPCKHKVAQNNIVESQCYGGTKHDERCKNVTRTQKHVFWCHHHQNQKPDYIDYSEGNGPCASHSWWHRNKG